MKVVQYVKQGGSHWSSPARPDVGAQAQLALVFGGRDALSEPESWRELHELFPNARIVACSTAGQIAGAHVYDDGMVATAIHFDTTKVKVEAITVFQNENSSAGVERWRSGHTSVRWAQ